MRNLSIHLLLAATTTATAAPASSCPPTDSSLVMLSNFTTSQRYAEACGVAQIAVERVVTSNIKQLRVCLEARKVPAAKIDEAVRNGNALADHMLPTMRQDPAFCTRFKDDFGKAG
jgi:hypothetical protein